MLEGPDHQYRSVAVPLNIVELVKKDGFLKINK